MNELAAIRAHRTEVDALLAFRHAASEARPAAWWRLQQARCARLSLLPAEQAARLQSLPPPPPGALSPVQAVRYRFGWLRPEEASPPERLRQARAKG
jgi:hypothetical protein